MTTKIIKAGTKQAERLLETWCNIAAWDIFGAYERPSIDKCRAWKMCRDICEHNNGTSLHICSHNTFSFTVGFDTDEYHHLITKTYHYLIEK